MKENTWETIFKFNNDPNVIKLRNLYSRPSYFEVLGLDRIEALHSNFLAWLFSNPNLRTNRCDNPAVRFLEVIIQNDLNNVINIAPKLINAVASRSLIINDVWVEKEVTYKDKQYNSRIDLIVTCDVTYDNEDKEVVFYIENKVGARETRNQAAQELQTMTYYRQYYDSAAQQIQLFVFLTPSDSLECGCEHFVKMTYSDLLQYVLEPAVTAAQSNTYDRMFIIQYIRALGVQAMNHQGTNYIMAISNAEKVAYNSINENYMSLFLEALAAKVSHRYAKSTSVTYKKWDDFLKKIGYKIYQQPNQQLIAFWDSNSSLIMSAIELSNLENKEEILRMIAALIKDYSKYTLEYNGDKKENINKSHLAKEIVEAYIKLKPIGKTNVQELVNFFESVRSPFIYTTKPGNEKNYDAIEIICDDNSKFSVWVPNNCWAAGSKHFQKLLAIVDKINGLTVY